MEKTYAFVKDNVVVNTAIIDDTNVELMQHLKQELNLDYVVEATEKTQIGATYDGVLFWTHKPYESWIKGEIDWIAPLPKPSNDKQYEWDETTVSWVEIAKPYESWTFNGEAWEAPSPKPSLDKFYIWNENELQWKEVLIDFEL
jgi:hypothetical protein